MRNARNLFRQTEPPLDDVIYGGPILPALYDPLLGRTDFPDGGAGDDYIRSVKMSHDDLTDPAFLHDRLIGGVGNDRLIGGRGNDFRFGGPGHDFLQGGLGADTMGGGTGDDTFVVKLGASGTAVGQMDNINFLVSHGSNPNHHDRIDLTALHDDLSTAVSPLSHTGTPDFTASWQVRLKQIGHSTFVEINEGGSLEADMRICPAGLGAAGLGAAGLGAAGLGAAGLSAAGLSAAGLSAAGLSAAGLSAAGLSALDFVLERRGAFAAPRAALLRRSDRSEVGRDILAASGQFEGHLGMGAVLAGLLLEPGGGIDDIGRDRGRIPFGAIGTGGHNVIAIFETSEGAYLPTDHAEEVGPDLAALLDCRAIGRDDGMAGFAFLEGLLADFGITREHGGGKCQKGEAQNQTRQQQFHRI